MNEKVFLTDNFPVDHEIESPAVILSFPLIGDVWVIFDPAHYPLVMKDGLPCLTVKDLKSIMSKQDYNMRLQTLKRLCVVRLPVVIEVLRAFPSSRVSRVEYDKIIKSEV
jgi:hypothetical protein